MSRSSWYYKGIRETPENLELMRIIDKQYLKTPFYGSRRMTAWLVREGHPVNRKRIQRLMRTMRIEGIAPGPRTSVGKPHRKIYPYLLRSLVIDRPDQVWSTDITYLPMRSGFMYLMAIIDWFSRYILDWRLSNTLDLDFCVEGVAKALEDRIPEIFNTDQGSQFTSPTFTEMLSNAGVKISMDGKGRALDNVCIERFWRSLKYEDIYPKDYQTVPELIEGLTAYIRFYNTERLHMALGYRTPEEVYEGR